MSKEQASPKRAVALLYNPKRSAAPTVVASGSHRIAEKIIATAVEAGVQIKQDPDLAELLAKIPVGEEIPATMYQTIAEILAFVYSVDTKYQKKNEEEDKKRL
jgi:flagellar biosynthesis protein